MRREGTPARMQVVEPRLEQAAEESTDLRLHYQVAPRAYWHQSDADKARAGAPGPPFQGVYCLFQVGRFIANK